MAIITFNQYLNEVGGAIQDLQRARDRLEALLSRHNSAGFSSLPESAYLGQPVTKAQYDAVMVSATNFIDTWWAAGHGTNIENYLTEHP